MPRISKEQFKDNLPYLTKILYQKFNIAYGYENDVFLFANESGNDEYDNNINTKYYNKYEFVANGFIISLIFMITLTLTKELFKKEKNKLLIIIALIMTGYTCVLIFGGVQPRYKTLLFSCMCIMAACSLNLKEGEEE